MNISLIPSLQHLSCSRMIASLFNHLEVQMDFYEKNYEDIESQVKDAITRVAPCVKIQDKLEEFIEPLLREIVEWLRALGRCVYEFGNASTAVLETIPRCWRSDGTIDREKSVRIVIKNENLHPMKRFELACTYCCFNEAFYLWNNLFESEREFLRTNFTAIVKYWIEWLESSSTKNWESFLAWTLENSLCLDNVFVLKHALKTISPAERNQYLLNFFIGKDISNDVMRFCISALTKDEREQIFRKAPAKVISCMISWPLRPIFLDMAAEMWSYLTEESFCDVLRMILKTLKGRKMFDIELLSIVKKFWEQSPDNFQNAAKDNPELLAPLQFILDFEDWQFFVNGKKSEMRWRAFVYILYSSNDVTRFQETLQYLESQIM